MKERKNTINSCDQEKTSNDQTSLTRSIDNREHHGIGVIFLQSSEEERQTTNQIDEETLPVVSDLQDSRKGQSLEHYHQRVAAMIEQQPQRA